MGPPTSWAVEGALDWELVAQIDAGASPPFDRVADPDNGKHSDGPNGETPRVASSIPSVTALFAALCDSKHRELR